MAEPRDTAATEQPRFDEVEQTKAAALSIGLGATSTGNVVHIGRKGAYYEADPDLRFPASGSTTERMAALGYELLGALLCERFHRVVVRCYSRPGGDAHGLLLLPPWKYRAIEFLTRFADGTSLTTTTHPGPGDDPARKLYRLRCPDLAVAELEARHRVALAAHAAARGTTPLVVEHSLSGAARALDDFLARYDA
jgi:hypothetical protein